MEGYQNEDNIKSVSMKNNSMTREQESNAALSVQSSVKWRKSMNTTNSGYMNERISKKNFVQKHEKIEVHSIVPSGDSFVTVFVEQKDYLMDENAQQMNTTSNEVIDRVLSLPIMLTETEDESNLSLELFSSEVMNTNTTSVNVEQSDSVEEDGNYMGENESLPSSNDDSSENINPIVRKMKIYSQSSNNNHCLASNNKSFGETTNLLVVCLY